MVRDARIPATLISSRPIATDARPVEIRVVEHMAKEDPKEREDKTEHSRAVLEYDRVKARVLRLFDELP